MTSGVRCRKCGLLQFAEPICKACGSELPHPTRLPSLPPHPKAQRSSMETASQPQASTDDSATKFGDEWGDLCKEWQTAILNAMCPRCKSRITATPGEPRIRCSRCGAHFPSPETGLRVICLTIYRDLCRFLATNGLDRPIDAYEALVFAMFVVTDAYTLKKGLNQGAEQLERFHSEMLNHAMNEIFLKEEQGKHVADVEAFSASFQRLIQARYAEYRPLLADALDDPKRVKFCSSLLCPFADHLFVEPLTSAEKERVFVAAGMQFLTTLRACLDTFVVETS